MIAVTIVVPSIPPSGNNYVRHGVVAGQLRSYKTSEARKFSSEVAARAGGMTIAPATDSERRKVAYRVTVTIFLGKGDRRDADNSLKVSIDSLTAAGVIHSDARVAEAIGRVVWNQRDDPRNPRTVIFAEVM